MIWFRSFTFKLSYLFCSPCTTGEPSREVRKETDILGCWTLGGRKRASEFYSCNDLSQSKPISVCIFVEDDWEICTEERSLVCNHKNRWVRYRVEKKLLSGTSPFCPRVLSLQKKIQAIGNRFGVGSSVDTAETELWLLPYWKPMRTLTDEKEEDRRKRATDDGPASVRVSIATHISYHC